MKRILTSTWCKRRLASLNISRANYVGTGRRFGRLIREIENSKVRWAPPEPS